MYAGDDVAEARRVFDGLAAEQKAREKVKRQKAREKAKRQASLDARPKVKRPASRIPKNALAVLVINGMPEDSLWG